MKRVEQVVPSVREKLGVFAPGLKPSPPPCDVSGTDVGKQVIIEYEGGADSAAVLDHYAKGFAAQRYAQTVLLMPRRTNIRKAASVLP